jgi:dTDP-4-dehydrorhamnose reductase
MRRLASERDTLSVIDDQFGAPTGAELLADVTGHALLAATRRPSVTGTYHLAADGETTWHGYANHVIGFARAAGHPVKVAADAICAIPASAYPTPAKRPGNSRLATQKLRHTFGLTLPHWTAGVDRVLSELLER